MAEIISKTQVFNELTNEELEIVISFAATLIQSRDKNMEAKYLFSKFNKHIERLKRQKGIDYPSLQRYVDN